MDSVYLASKQVFETDALTDDLVSFPPIHHVAATAGVVQRTGRLSY